MGFAPGTGGGGNPGGSFQSKSAQISARAAISATMACLRNNRSGVRGVISGQNLKLAAQRRALQHIEECFGGRQIRGAAPHDKVVAFAVQGNEVEIESFRGGTSCQANVGFIRNDTISRGEMPVSDAVVSLDFLRVHSR